MCRITMKPNANVFVSVLFLPLTLMSQRFIQVACLCDSSRVVLTVIQECEGATMCLPVFMKFVVVSGLGLL